MSYQDFAYYYDSLMDEEFYSDYVKFLLSHIKGETILELGCGTGLMAIELSKENKNVYATDLSPQMLEVAKMNAINANVDLMLGKVDMCDFSINKPVDTVLCLCDSLNYIHKKNQIAKVFKNVHNSLKNDGVFIFDVHSLYKIDTVFENYKEEAKEEEFYFSWSVNKTGNGKIHHHVIIDDFENNEHVEEDHYQTTWDVSTYIELLNDAGFTMIELFSDFNDFNEKGLRHIFIVTKKED